MTIGAIFIIISVVIVNGCSNNKIKKKTAWDYDKLKGKVEKIRVKTYIINDTNNQITSDYLVKYNIDGNWTEWKSFNTDNSKKYLEKPIYNEQGNVISRNDYAYQNSDSILVRKFKYKNDKQGNIIETFCKNSKDSLLWKQKFKYDDDGNIIEILNFATLDSLAWRKISKYNQANRIIEEVKYNFDGNLVSKSIYLYDNSGNNIEIKLYGKNDSLEAHITYSYDQQGNYIEVQEYSSERKLTTKRSCEYDYDTKGNWIKVVKFINDIPEKMTKRQIVYY